MHTRAVHVRTRTIIGVLACCCAALAGCAAGPRNAPNTTVSTPTVGKPPPPASVQAALSSEAFTPYAALGIARNDGLAPGESQYTLGAPCMNAAGYPGVTTGQSVLPANVPTFNSPSLASLAFTWPWGEWGYLGTADAQQYGFRVTLGAAIAVLGYVIPPAGPPNPPAAEQAAGAKCGTIMRDFSNAIQNGPLAGIAALGNDIYADMAHDRAVIAASRAWSACMSKNGYSSLGSPQNVLGHEMQAMGNPNPTATVSPAANHAQIAAAVTDATCTQSSDLAGIYFAVQASYERQLVSANRLALTAAVSRYRTAYTEELKRLPVLLRTTKAQPFPRRAGRRPSG